jgi:DNA-binding XRE family transcriptional regulator
MTIGQALKNLRKKHQYKQQWVADNIGIRQGHLCLIENGKISPPIKTLSKFARFYKIKPSIENTIIEIFTKQS